MASPNVIPMADIMLVLLIIFMVVTPLLQRGKQVDLARVNNPIDMKAADADDAIIVAVTRDGNIFLGRRRLRRKTSPTRSKTFSLTGSTRPCLSRVTRGPSMAWWFRWWTKFAPPAWISSGC